MKQNPRITDEHIVAYLDGELHVSSEVERELRATPAAAEYSAIGKAMAHSRADSRFMLSASIDASAKKMLSRAISSSRGEVRTAAPAPSAAPVRSIPATRSIKFIWARRASVGFAFATLLAFLWFNTGNKNEQITQVPVPRSTPAPIQQTAPALPEVVATQPGQLAANIDMQSHSAAPTVHTVKNPDVSKNLTKKDLATNTTETQTETPGVTAHEDVKADPAEIMISHRYAKMIKATRAVEVTEQDRM